MSYRLTQSGLLRGLALTLITLVGGVCVAQTPTVSSSSGVSSTALSSSATASAPAAPTLSDVRLLIDISGSMKKTDPRNLRRPAVELLSRLLPDQSRAGIWLFAQGVNELMPLALVDEHWRQEAAGRAVRINSPGLLTHIGAVLETASQPGAPANYKRHLVMLTDGVVDIGPEAVANLNERRRILVELLPRLKAEGFVVHTLALSPDADQELMKKLAQATDGVFAVAQTADELMQAFLRIFDQAVPAERLPLVDNSFKVDASIQELTALIFRDDQVPSSVLVAPDGREFSASDPAQRVKWYNTASYDLITLREPQPGVWRVKTQMAPNSRVTIVSNLQLQVDPLANQVQQGQALELAYRFLADGAKLTNPEFLHLLQAQWQLTAANAAEADAQALVLAAQEGEFHQRLAPLAQPGDYTLRLRIDGKTFEREFVHRFQVSEAAFSLSLEQGGYRISVNPALVEPGTASVTLTLVVDQQPQPPQLVPPSGDLQWHYPFAPSQAGSYQLRFHGQAQGLDGAPVETWLTPEPVVVNPEPVPLDVAPVADTTDVPAEPVVIHQTPLWLYIALGVANLLVLILGVVVYRLIASKGSRAEMQQQENTLAAGAAAPAAIDLADGSIELPLDLSVDGPASDVSSEPLAEVSSAPGDSLVDSDLMDNNDLIDSDEVMGTEDLMDSLLPMDDLDDPDNKPS